MFPEIHHGPNGAIAYEAVSGRGPAVVFLGGLASDMTGTKATFLRAWCLARGRGFLRFDYTGHGASAGRFEDGTIGAWAEDARSIIDAVTRGPLIIVGSSMGGWVMLEVALAMPGRIAALVGIAPAPDFTEDLIWAGLGEEERARLEREGALTLATPHDPAGYRIGRALIEDGRTRLRLRGAIGLDVPVRLLHGQEDSSVPWETSLRLAACLEGGDVRVTLIKDGDHRLARETDLEALGTILGSLPRPEAAGEGAGA